MSKIVATLTGNRISCVIDNRFRSLSLDSDQGKKLADAVRRDPQDIDEIREIADVAAYIAKMSLGRVELDDMDRLRLDGQVVDYGVTSIFLKTLQQGFGVEPLARFLENVSENPEEDIAQDLFAFLQAGNLPLTDDGCFLAFKRVRPDYYDYHSGTVHYPIGGIVSIPRENCAKHRTACGSGLHVCYFDYLPCFHGGSGRILITKVNPKNVTDIPRYDGSKLKCCEMEVLGEIPEEDAKAHFTAAVDRRYVPTPAEAVDPDADDATAQDGATTIEPEDRADEIDWLIHASDEGFAAGQRGDSYLSINLPGEMPADRAEAYTLRWQARYGDGAAHASPPRWAEAGFADGEMWAVNDTAYDMHPQSGANAKLAKAAGAQAFQQYAEGFRDGYEGRFGRTP